MIFNIIKYTGAAYLIFLGVKLLCQKNLDLAVSPDRFIPKNVGAVQIFVQAFGVAVSNPKAIIFLTALFPQFLDIKSALVPQFAMLVGTLMFFSFTFLMIYALLAHRVRSWLTKSSRIRAFNRTSGSIFIGFGVLLATSTHK